MQWTGLEPWISNFPSGSDESDQKPAGLIFVLGQLIRIETLKTFWHSHSEALSLLEIPLTFYTKSHEPVKPVLSQKHRKSCHVFHGISFKFIQIL
jgi:hypothetical protein